MSAQATQLRKEARQLLWPWLAVTLGGLMSVIRLSNDQYSWGPLDFVALILPVGCLLGIPLLAALPLGSEFQHGTLPMLLAQPIGRRALWLRKIAITFGAVLPAAILYVFGWRLWHEAGRDFWMAAAWMVATTAGAAAWTLIARSTIGGLALSSGAYWIIFIVWLYVSDHLPGNANHSAAFHWATATLLMGYCVAAVWLGRRMFLRFQAADGVLGREALTLVPATRFLPQISWEWLRSRPRGAILNLIRREIHLLRIVWLLSLLSLASWIFLVMFHFVPGRAEVLNSYTSDIPVLLAVLLCFLIAVLAGSLSLGEEKTSGTHTWHLTLPLSAPIQWLIKLLVAMAVCLICALGVVLIVLLVRGWLVGTPYSYFGRAPLWFWIFYAVFSTLLAFWCSCHVKGTVRAVLCFFPLLFFMSLVVSSGLSMGFRTVQNSKTILDWFLGRFDPFTDNRIFAIPFNPIYGFVPSLVLTVTPFLIVCLIQGLRAFVFPFDERKIRIVRSAIPLLAILFCSTFLSSALGGLGFALRREQMDIVREAHTAIENSFGDQNANVAIQKFSADDLAKVSPFSERTKYWLQDATVLVHREKPWPGNPPGIQWPFEESFIDRSVKGKIPIPYTATIRTQKGSCAVSFWTNSQMEWGFLSESCQ